MTKIGLSLSLVAFVGVMVASTLPAQAQSAEVRLKASMVSGAASGKAEYRERGNRKRLNVQAEDLAGSTISPQNVFINGVSVGTMVLVACPAPATQLLCGEMELNSQDGQVVPQVRSGDTVSVGFSPAVLAGVRDTDEREQHSDQPAHDMGVAVAEIGQHRLALVVALELARQPDLAGAALHLVGVVAVGVGKGRQRAAELDQIAVAIVPLIQQREIVDDLVDRGRVVPDMQIVEIDMFDPHPLQTRFHGAHHVLAAVARRHQVGGAAVRIFAGDREVIAIAAHEFADQLLALAESATQRSY